MTQPMPFARLKEQRQALNQALAWYGYANVLRSLAAMCAGLAAGLLSGGYVFHQASLIPGGWAALTGLVVTASGALYCSCQGRRFGRLANP